MDRTSLIIQLTDESEAWRERESVGENGEPGKREGEGMVCAGAASYLLVEPIIHNFPRLCIQ